MASEKYGADGAASPGSAQLSGGPPLAPLPHVAQLVPYAPGKPIEELQRELGLSEIVKLASNENPLGPSPRALAAASAALAATHRYPDGAGHALRHRLATKLGVGAERIVLGAGSNELIDLLVRAYCAPVDASATDPRTVVTFTASFIAYRIAAATQGVAFYEVATGPDFAYDDAAIERLLAAVRPTTRLVFLANPNNPTGRYASKPLVERLIRELPLSCLLVVDEAYVEYATAADYPDLLPLAAALGSRRVVTLRTFSKAYGLAGFRVGYGIADPEVAGVLNRVRLPFNVSAVAQEAALAALDDSGHLAASVAANSEGVRLLEGELRAAGWVTIPTQGNFLLVDVGRSGCARTPKELYEALLTQGVIVRPMAPFGLPGHLRISVGTLAENRRLLDALARVGRG